MKFSCTQENLRKGLSMVSHVASRNANLPILGNVLLKVKSGILTLLTTNLEIAMTTSIRGKMEREGEFSVGAKLFADYVSLLPKERVDIEVVDKELLVKCGNQETSLRGSDAAEFPLVPVFEKKGEYQLPTADLQQGIGQVLFAAASDETRPEMNGILFWFLPPEKVILVGTDGFRLAERTLRLKGVSGEEKKIILPGRSLQEVVRIFQEEEVVKIEWSDNQVLFRCGETEFVTRIIEGQYPDYQQIIPKQFQTEVLLDVSELGNAVKTAGIFSRTGVNDVHMEFFPEKKNISIRSANTQLGKNTTTLEAKKFKGNKNSITFNYRYLAEGLAAMPSSEVIVQMIDDANPGVVCPEGEGSSYVYIVMPIKQ